MPTFGAPWTDADRLRLQEIAATMTEDFVARGATGHPLLWERERERERVAILADLDSMLTDDNAWRGECDARVVGQRIDLLA